LFYKMRRPPLLGPQHKKMRKWVVLSGRLQYCSQFFSPPVLRVTMWHCNLCHDKWSTYSCPGLSS
jgi:hypothetical protein